MSPNRGKQAEVSFTLFCLQKGWQIYVPVVSDGPVDAVFDRGDGVLLRGQIKCGRVAPERPGHVRVDLRRHTPDRASYAAGMIDVLVVLYEEQFWIVPWAEVGDRHLSIPLAGAGSKYDAWRVT